MTTLHGFPITIEFFGILLITTLIAPITELLPIVIPFKIVQLAPINTLSSIIIGLAGISVLSCLLLGSEWWKSVSIIILCAPIITLLPILIFMAASNVIPDPPKLSQIIISDFFLKVTKMRRFCRPTGIEFFAELNLQQSTIKISEFSYLRITGNLLKTTFFTI